MAESKKCVVKCRNCSYKICESPPAILLTAHSNLEALTECKSLDNRDLVFLDSSNSPTFIQDLIEESNWTKGKIACPHCKAKLGIFNFVGGLKCDCNSHLLPAMYFIRSKVDILNR